MNKKVFIAENGPAIDRFLEVKPGANYLWNGDERSIATNAAYVMQPSLGPVQIDFYPSTNNSSIFPKLYENNFFLALSAASQKGKPPGIYTIPYSIKSGLLTAVPDYFLKYRGTTEQVVTGLVFGNDALYFTPLIGFHDGKSAVLKIKHDPNSTHKYTSFINPRKIKDFIRQKGCMGCHSITGKGGFRLGGTVGPVLDRGDGPMRKRILTKINSTEFLNNLEELNKSEDVLISKYKDARLALANTKGLEQLKLYLKYQILEPRFANLYSPMPNMGLTEKEAEAIVDFLVAQTPKGLKNRLKKYLPKPSHKYALATFLIGLILGILLWVSMRWLMHHTIFKPRK